MRTRFPAAVLLVWCVTGQAMEADVIFRSVAPCVWLVQTFSKVGTRLANGSAVVVRDGQLLTNCHVLGSAHAVTVSKAELKFKATLLYIDLDRDLCVLTVSDQNFDAPPAQIGDSAHLAVGQKVFAIGNPVGLETSLSDGLISALRYDEDKELVFIQTSAPISPGSSGGGLFDVEGRLVGITQASVSLVRSQNLNFALPINWLETVPARSREQLLEYFEAKQQSKK